MQSEVRALSIPDSRFPTLDPRFSQGGLILGALQAQLHHGLDPHNANAAAPKSGGHLRVIGPSMKAML